MESTPDSGVDIKKDEVAPLLAPCFFKFTAIGITEQEQRGRGTPTIAAYKTVHMLFPPKSFMTVWSETVEWITPARSNPRIRKGEKLLRYSQDEFKKSIVLVIGAFSYNLGKQKDVATIQKYGKANHYEIRLIEAPSRPIFLSKWS